MSWLTLVCGALFLWVQLRLYRRQIQRFPARDATERQAYAVTLPTRLFRVLKFPLGAAVILHLALLPLEASSPGWPRWLLGGTVAVCGLVLLDRSLLALGANFAPCDRGTLPRELAHSGPYRLLKHPIYLANLLIFGGMAVQSCSWLIATSWVILALIYFFSARDENRALRSLDRLSSYQS